MPQTIYQTKEQKERKQWEEYIAIQLQELYGCPKQSKRQIQSLFSCPKQSERQIQSLYDNVKKSERQNKTTGDTEKIEQKDLEVVVEENRKDKIDQEKVQDMSDDQDELNENDTNNQRKEGIDDGIPTPTIPAEQLSPTLFNQASKEILNRPNSEQQTIDHPVIGHNAKERKQLIKDLLTYLKIQLRKAKQGKCQVKLKKFFTQHFESIQSQETTIFLQQAGFTDYCQQVIREIDRPRQRNQNAESFYIGKFKKLILQHQFSAVTRKVIDQLLKKHYVSYIYESNRMSAKNVKVFYIRRWLWALKYPKSFVSIKIPTEEEQIKKIERQEMQREKEERKKGKDKNKKEKEDKQREREDKKKKKHKMQEKEKGSESRT